MFLEIEAGCFLLPKIVVGSMKKLLLRTDEGKAYTILKGNHKKELYERFGGLEELVNWILSQISMGCRSPIFCKSKIKRKCSRKVIKRISRKLHEAGECDAEDDYSRGYDDAITFALKILLEETGCDIENIID